MKLRLLLMSSLDAMNELLQFEGKCMRYNYEKFSISFHFQFLYFLCNCIYYWVKKLNLIVHS